MMTVPHKMVRLERTSDYRSVGLLRFYCAVLCCGMYVHMVTQLQYVRTYVHTFIQLLNKYTHTYNIRTYPATSTEHFAEQSYVCMYVCMQDYTSCKHYEWLCPTSLWETNCLLLWDTSYTVVPHLGIVYRKQTLV